MLIRGELTMSDNLTRENKMGTMPIGRLLLNMGLPMVISMLVQALYNVVDSIYVSRISESAVTALTLAFPVQNMMIAFASGTAVGVNALLSKSLGEKNQEQANRAAGNGITLMLIFTVLFMLFGFFGARPYFEMQSTVEETVEGGIDYTAVCTIFGLGVFMQVLFERMLQATGRTVYSMISQATGAILNIILDPIFIFGYFGVPAMGMAGAAVATVIGQWVGALLGLIFNLTRNPDVQLSLENMKLRKVSAGPILSVGIPSIIMIGIGSVMNFGMNQIFQGFNETATGVFGIYYKLQSFFFMPLLGVNNAIISIIAFNYGARRPDRMLKTLKLGCLTGLCFMVSGLLVFQFAPDLLLGLFELSEDFLIQGRSALRIVSWHFPIAAFCIVLGACFQALGNGIYSSITSLCRQLFVLLPVAYLLSLTGDVHAVWWAFLIAECASATVTAILFARTYRRQIRPMLGECEMENS